MSEAKSQIGFEQAGLGSILKHNQLMVPPNQREYAWTDRQVTQLFHDLARAISSDATYFLGTIVTIPRVNGELEVVDGQQRLATTAILLAAIRDYLRERNEHILVESIDNEFLSGIDRPNRVRIPKLKLNTDDNALFAEIIEKGHVTDRSRTPNRASHERILTAAKEARSHVRNVVAGLDPRDHGDLLNRWVTFIEHSALAVLLRVPNDADAYKMFETLNDRGLRTSQADLIKNYLFGHAATRINEIQTRWAYMRGALESLEEDEVTTVTFLRHALIVLRGFLREAEVYDIVQDLVNSASSAIEFSSTLEGLSHAYVASFNPEHERWSSYSDSARRAIEVFNLLKIRPMQPLLLAITAKMNGIEASASFQFALSLGVRLLIASTTRSGSVEGPLADAANAVYLGTIQSVGGLRERLHTITPSDQEFREAFEVARVSNARLARYLLRSLEMTASGGAEPWFIPLNDRSVITLEHVLPRKPGTGWPGFTDDDVRRYSPRLGNLALLQAKANSNLRSDAFSERTGVYASSPYILTNRIGRQPQWTPEAIVERQRWMADLAVRTWPVTG